MSEIEHRPRMKEGSPVVVTCRDGVRLGGHMWCAAGSQPIGNIIINPATGVPARYYHRYARFLAAHDFDVLTYDYRGIGLSRPDRLRGIDYRWKDWGERDFEAALLFLKQQGRGDRLVVVGHSVGGFLPGLARSSHLIDRMLTVGAQYAWWGDYASSRRLSLLLKWHVIMPVLTAVCGYFPGRRIGWLEDLPAGVANEWSFRGRRFERSHPAGERQAVLTRIAAVSAKVLVVCITDDEFGTKPAIRRTLGYYTGADRTIVVLRPADLGREAIGHFSLFHDSHAAGFWMGTLPWLRNGCNPWPGHVIDL